MRKNVILGLVTAVLVVFGAASANALALDATIGGIFTDSSMATPVGDLIIDAEGNASATLVAGQAILVNINIDNTVGDAIETIGATLTIQGNQVQFVGGIIPSGILQEGGFGGASLSNIGSGAIKGNTPNQPGDAGDVWVQALAYGTPGGVDGTGTLVDNLQLLFIVTGASGSDLVDLVFGLTAGDVITAPGGASIATPFSSAVVNVPEPGTALLMGLGLAGLAGAGRRKS